MSTDPPPPRGRRAGPAAMVRRWLRRPAEPAVEYDAARQYRDGYTSTGTPAPDEASEALRDRVDELAGRKALDQGSAHVFDTTVDAWATEWTLRGLAEHLARQNVLQQRENHAAAEAERLTAEARLTRQRLVEAEARLAWLHAGADPRRHPQWGADPFQLPAQRRRDAPAPE